MQMIKKNWVYILFVFSVIVFTITKLIKIKPKETKASFDITVIKVDSGFGYQITKNKYPYIQQVVIPAIEGEKAFLTEEQAKRTGQLVLYKIKHGLMPSITIKELDSLQIIR